MPGCWAAGQVRGIGHSSRDIAALPFPVRLGGQLDSGGGLAGFFLAQDPVYYPRFGLSGRSHAGASPTISMGRHRLHGRKPEVRASLGVG